MKTLATLLVSMLISGQCYAAEIINSEETTTESVTVKNRVEAVYVSTTQLTVHLEDVTSIGDEVVKTQRTETITIGIDETFVNPEDGETYNTFEYFIGLTGIDFDDVKAAIVAYKALEASLQASEEQE